MGEEKWSVSSLTNYKMVRSMAWLYHNTKDAVNEFSKKYNCDLALAEEYLKVVRGIRNQQPFYVTDEDGEETGEDVALDDTWNYADILWNGIQAEKVQRAFEKLNYRRKVYRMDGASRGANTCKDLLLLRSLFQHAQNHSKGGLVYIWVGALGIPQAA